MQRSNRTNYCTLRYVLYITLNLALCVGLWNCGIFGILWSILPAAVGLFGDMGQLKYTN